MATTLEMATYLDCLNLKRNSERGCPTSVLQMTGCPSQYFLEGQCHAQFLRKTLQDS